MSSFLFATDLHGNVESYERLFAADADAVVLGGDLLPHIKGTLEHRLETQREFCRGFLSEKFSSRPCYWIAGNDDWAAALPLLEGKGTAIHGRAATWLHQSSAVLAHQGWSWSCGHRPGPAPPAGQGPRATQASVSRRRTSSSFYPSLRPATNLRSLALSQSASYGW